MEASPIMDEGGNIIGGVAGVIDVTKRRQAEEELKKYHRHLEHLVKERTEALEGQKIALEQKNIALREIVGQIEHEKNIIKKDVLTNINELITPALKELKAKGNADDKSINLIKQSLEKVTSSFGSTLTGRNLKLTPREIETCNMIEKGFTNKDIANFLNISVQSIEGYRKNIRKKLGLSKKKVNLTSYLRNLS